MIVFDMVLTVKSLATIIMIFSSNALASSEVALTFDDLPFAGKTVETPMYILDNLSKTFKAGHIPAAGFLIGKSSSENSGLNALAVWAGKGMSLYNHSCSHEKYSEQETNW